MERGKKPEALAAVIAAALKFDFEGDPEAKEVQDYINANGLKAAISHFTELAEDSELFRMIEEKAEA